MSRTWIGPLERRVLDALWRGPSPASVRDLTPSFPEIAYTTLMTTLERLHRKGLVAREKRGRAFFYAAHMSRAQFHATQAARAIRAALDETGTTPELLLSCLVDTVSERDVSLLDDLSDLIRTRLAEIDEEAS